MLCPHLQHQGGIAMKKNYEHNQEKSYNIGELFFWFDETGKINKIYDRQREKDHFHNNEIFPDIFKAAAEKLEIFQLRDLKARLVEPDYQKICNDILVEKINSKLAAH